MQYLHALVTTHIGLEFTCHVAHARYFITPTVSHEFHTTEAGVKPETVAETGQHHMPSYPIISRHII